MHIEILSWLLNNRIVILPILLAIEYALVIIWHYTSDELPEKDPKCIWHTTVEELIRVYDGDTFYAHVKGHDPIDNKPIGIRIRGIDTPELKDKTLKVKAKALQAKDIATKCLTSARTIHLYNVSLEDKYGRMLATVFYDRKDLAKLLLEKGLAKPYDGGKKSEWV